MRQNTDFVTSPGGGALRVSLYKYCAEHGKAHLLRQWHPAKNGSLTPEDLSHGSNRSVWWQCDRGHEWQARVFSRVTSNTGCPYCAHKRVWPGEELVSLYPGLAAQWHPEKNAPLTPDQISPGSSRRVWWQCDKGHTWQSAVKTRVSGTGCPVCKSRRIQSGENDLASRNPALASQWHPERNLPLTPAQVFPTTRRKVWWQCEQGHVWQASIQSRAEGTGCPVCAGKQVIPGENDLATVFPQVASQWHREKNGTISPRELSPYSNKKVWWTCSLGHDYQAVVGERTNSGTGCPYCAGRRVLPGFNDLATKMPQVAREWHPELNGGLTPDMVTAGSRKKVWWQCDLGHAWLAVVYSRTGEQLNGCPVCAGRVKKHPRGDIVFP